MKRFAVFFLFLILFLNTAFALDFIAAGDTEVSAFRCYIVEKNVYVSNPGDSVLDVALSVGGSAADFVKFSVLDVQLAPGETKDVVVFYEIPCGVAEGVYDLDIYFSSLDVEQVLSQNIQVFTPDDLFIDVIPGEQEIDPCSIASYEINIDNPTIINESYHLSLDSFKDEYAVEESFTLNGFENKTVSLKISPEDCTKSGDFDFNLVALTEKTNLTKILPLALKIRSFGIPEIAAGIDTVRTDFEEKEAELLVKNLGNTDVIYDVSVEGPEWISVKDKLAVKAGSESALKLSLRPFESVEIGEYEIKVKLALSDSDAVYSKNFTILLKPFSLIERKPYIVYIPLIIIIVLVLLIVGFVLFSRSKAYKELRAETLKKRAEKKAKKIKVSDEKKGLKDKKKSERLKKKEELKKERIELKKKLKRERLEKKKKKKEEKKRKREEKLKLKNALKEKKKKEHLERIAAKEKGRASVKHDVMNKVKSEFKLIPRSSVKKSVEHKVHSGVYWFVFLFAALLLIFLCGVYGLIAILAFVIALICSEFSAAKTFVKRWNFIEKNSCVPLFTKWKFGIYSFNAVVLKNVEKLSLTVKKFAVRIEGLRCFAAFAVSTSIENVLKIDNVKFRVPKAWFNRHNVSLDDFKLLKRVKDRWQKQKLTFIRADKDFFYFAAEKIGSGEFVLAGKPAPKPAKKRFNILWIAIIGIIALFALQPVLTTKGIPSQVWIKDTQHSIKLGQYFHDPDLDLLSFSADEAKNIDISFDKDLALLNPKPGWVGEEYTVFHATDVKGGVASSNPVKLVVKEKVGFSKGITVLNIIVLALLLFLVILALFEKKSKSDI